MECRLNLGVPNGALAIKGLFDRCILGQSGPKVSASLYCRAGVLFWIEVCKFGTEQALSTRSEVSGNLSCAASRFGGRHMKVAVNSNSGSRLKFGGWGTCSFREVGIVLFSNKMAELQL